MERNWQEELTVNGADAKARLSQLTGDFSLPQNPVGLGSGTQSVGEPPGDRMERGDLAQERTDRLASFAAEFAVRIKK